MMNKIVLRSLIVEAIEFAAAFLLLCFWNYIGFVIILLIAATAEYFLILRCKDFKTIFQSILIRIVAGVIISVIICEIYGYLHSSKTAISDGGPGGGAVLAVCIIGSLFMFPSSLTAVAFYKIIHIIYKLIHCK